MSWMKVLPVDSLLMINNEKALSVFPVFVEEGNIWVEIEKS